ncbi:MAG TPA: hypothetical protein DCR55_02450 [Lentisphaeria bacterium]|nr:hypothetical protein [Lentisphaeria bacterium]
MPLSIEPHTTERIMKRFFLVLILAFSPGCVLAGESHNLAVDELPKVVLAAAQKAVLGFSVEEAEVEGKGKRRVYELEGTANGKSYEMEISAKGKLLELEREDDAKEEDE